MSRHLTLISLLLLSACSQFEMSRSYLSEMEHDDSTFYNPHEDFPVMSGDNGKLGRTLEEYAPGTPLSEEERYARKTRQALQQELRELEGRQNEYNFEFYETHKEKLASTSERIYFLKLPSRERADYLESRGLLKSERLNPENTRSPASMFGARSSELNLGMSKGEVIESWGKPARVEVAGNPMHENERWAYSVQGATKYIYFESGTVQGWE